MASVSETFAAPDWLLTYARTHSGDWPAYEQAKRVIRQMTRTEADYTRWIKAYTAAAGL